MQIVRLVEFFASMQFVQQKLTNSYFTQIKFSDFVNLCPPDMCRYTDNTVHVQGATWDDGCNYRCVCVDAKQNNYRCDARYGCKSVGPSSVW